MTQSIDATYRADILAIAELERARKSRLAYEAHLDREAERAAYDHSFDDGGMAYERERHP